MGLKFLGATDLATFLNDLQTEQSLVQEWAFANDGQDSTQSMPRGAYIHGLDRFIIAGRTALPPPGPVNDHFNRIRMPVLLGSVKAADTIVEQRPVSFFDHHEPIVPGDPLNPGGQRVYCANTGPNSDCEEIILATMVSTNAPAFITTPPANGPVNLATGRGAFVNPSLPGGYTLGATLSPSEGAHGSIVFEGLTDGIPGETNLTGANVYPAGLRLARHKFATCPAPVGTGVANDCDNAIVWQDLFVGGIDGRLLNTAGMASATEPNSEAPIAGHEFSWYPAQYVPDSDAAFGLPKGELFFFTDRFDIPASVAFQQSVYIKSIDFNPFNVAPSGGAPNRVHERVRFGPTSVDFDINPMFSVGGAGQQRNDSMQLAYHPLTLRFFMLQADVTFGITTPGPAPGGESFMGYWTRQVDPIGVSSPVARDVPRTNDITEWEGFVGGALGEPAAGVAVDWSLFRNSSELEVIVPVFPGFNDVANPPIDGDFLGSPEGTLVVRADTVVLVEGVDYTVSLSLGRITWITDQTGASVVDVTYEHRENNASPPHGTLLTPTSLTEANGRVFTQIRYPDDDALAGTIDRLIAALA